MAIPALVVAPGCGSARTEGAVVEQPTSSRVLDVRTIRPSVAALAGIPELRDHVPPPGEREVRLWIGGGVGIPHDLVRLRDSAGVVTGELIRYWPVLEAPEEEGPTSHDLMLEALRDQCTGFRREGSWGLCRGRFPREPDWAGMLRRAEDLGLWTLPHPDMIPYEPEPENELPWHTVRPHRRNPVPRGPTGRPIRVQIDGWGMGVELRHDDHYRSYLYRFPADNGFPEGKRAGAIATAFRDSLRTLLRLPDPVNDPPGGAQDQVSAARKPRCSAPVATPPRGDPPAPAPPPPPGPCS